MKKITRNLVAHWLPVRDKNTYKNDLGHILCIGGSPAMGGATILSATAAVYSGAGLVTVASAPENRTALHSAIPEAMFTNMYNHSSLSKAIQASSVVLLGPGLGRNEAAYEIFQFVLNSIQEEQWLVMDADALYFYAQLESNSRINTKNIVLTPHLGEWERISSIQPPAADVQKNQEIVNQLDSIVVLKQATTEVYLPEKVWENTAGNPSMATGGMGDTLAGMIAGFLGQFENKEQAVLSAVYLHSAIADELAETHYVTLPHQISEELPIFMKKLQKEG